MTGVDLTEFTKLQGARKKPPCPVATAIESLSAGDRAKVGAALRADELVGPGAIVQWLHQRGIATEPKLSPGYVRSHRKGTCTCPAT